MAAARACTSRPRSPAYGPRCAHPGSAPRLRPAPTASRRSCLCLRRPTASRPPPHSPSGPLPALIRRRGNRAAPSITEAVRGGKSLTRLVLRPVRLVGDDLVAGKLEPPAEHDLLRLARRRLEAPGEHAAPVAHVALARRRRAGQHLDLDVGDLAGRDLIFDHD